MAGYLPVELVAVILSWLPSKSLLRCRSVCKSWLSLISSTEFILMHLHNFNHLNPRNLVRRLEWRENKEEYSVHFDDESFTLDRHTPIEFPFNSNRDVIFYFRIIGCCNGVVCLSDDKCGPREDKTILWNPSIRRILTLIPPMNGSSYWRELFLVFGFGYDRVSDDYKVVRLAYDDCFISRPQVEIYTVKTAIWRAVEFPHDLPSFSISPYWTQVFFNGSGHWISCDWTPGVSHCSIMTFDMSTELFGEIELPEDLVKECPLKLMLAVVGESLAVIYSRHLGTVASGSSTYTIWAMKEYKNPASWTILQHLHYRNRGWERALRLRNNGDMITESYDGNLMFHNLCAFFVVFASCRGIIIEDSIFADRYQESLALLDAGHDVRSEERRVREGRDEGFEDEWLARFEASHIVPLLDE